MSNHTPGPWYMHDYTELFGNDPTNICVSCDELTELTICHMGNAVYASTEEARANACLIAAAPEMLNLLEDIAKAIAEGEGEVIDYLYGEDILQLLAKAKGETE